MPNVFFLVFFSFWLGNHTVAIFKGSETYDVVKTSCSTIFGQVNKLLQSKEVTIGGNVIPAEVYLGGDYKVKNKAYCKPLMIGADDIMNTDFDMI